MHSMPPTSGPEDLEQTLGEVEYWLRGVVKKCCVGRQSFHDDGKEHSRKVAKVLLCRSSKDVGPDARVICVSNAKDALLLLAVLAYDE